MERANPQKPGERNDNRMPSGNHHPPQKKVLEKAQRSKRVTAAIQGLDRYAGDRAEDLKGNLDKLAKAVVEAAGNVRVAKFAHSVAMLQPGPDGLRKKLREPLKSRRQEPLGSTHLGLYRSVLFVL